MIELPYWRIWPRAPPAPEPSRWLVVRPSMPNFVPSMIVPTYEHCVSYQKENMIAVHRGRCIMISD